MAHNIINNKMEKEIKSIEELCKFLNEKEDKNPVNYDQEVVDKCIADNGWVDWQSSTEHICSDTKSLISFDYDNDMFKVVGLSVFSDLKNRASISTISILKNGKTELETATEQLLMNDHMKNAKEIFCVPMIEAHVLYHKYLDMFDSRCIDISVFTHLLGITHPDDTKSIYLL